MKYLPYLLFLLVLPAVRADFTANFDAGKLTSPINAPMQVDNTIPSLNGSLLLLLDLGSSTGAQSNVLDPGQYASGTNFVLGVGGFNNNGGTDETMTAITATLAMNDPRWAEGDQLALRWFPQITLAQYNNGVLPTAGEYFGTYSPSSLGSTDGINDPNAIADSWTLVKSGSIHLDFYTSDSDFGGRQNPSAGFTAYQVQGAAEVVPEPSTWLLLGLGFLALVILPRRFVRRA